ncbi:MAG: 1-acyl-sn-glycerol-3-phosphate acyltransferase [Oceanicaulis sp.]
MSLDPRDEPSPAADARALVNALIEERAPSLKTRRRLWRLVRAVADPALGYRDAISLVEAVRELDAEQCFAFGDAFLDLDVTAEGVDRVPAEGPVLLIANHPGGIADGNAIWTALKGRRDDLVYFANRDALRICPGLRSRIIPVEWRRGDLARTRARETLKAAMEAFNAGKCVVIFPAGRMADWSWRARRLVEPAWAATGVSLARRFAAPVVPVGVVQRMPLAYYALAQIHEELRDVTLFHGLLRQRGARYRLRFGDPLDARALPGDDRAASEHLKQICEALAWGARTAGRA